MYTCLCVCVFARICEVCVLVEDRGWHQCLSQSFFTFLKKHFILLYFTLFVSVCLHTCASTLRNQEGMSDWCQKSWNWQYKWLWAACHRFYVKLWFSKDIRVLSLAPPPYFGGHLHSLSLMLTDSSRMTSKPKVYTHLYLPRAGIIGTLLQPASHTSARFLNCSPHTSIAKPLLSHLEIPIIELCKENHHEGEHRHLCILSSTHTTHNVHKLLSSL